MKRSQRTNFHIYVIVVHDLSWILSFEILIKLATIFYLWFLEILHSLNIIFSVLDIILDTRKWILDFENVKINIFR